MHDNPAFKAALEELHKRCTQADPAHNLEGWDEAPQVSQSPASGQSHAPAQPRPAPTPAAPRQTSVWTMLGRRLLSGHLDPEFRRQFPNYYGRPRPHFAPDQDSLGSAIRSAALNAASALCWPIVRMLARLRFGPAALSAQADPAFLRRRAAIRASWDESQKAPHRPEGGGAKPHPATAAPRSSPESAPNP